MILARAHLPLRTTAHRSSAADDFDWGDDLYMPRPKNEHVIYELHVGTFHRADASTQGTFYDAIEKLDYLAELGVLRWSSSCR
jgi:1,4-alpha-glucan branching enzyme